MQDPIIVDNFLSDEECGFLHALVSEQYDLQSKLYPGKYVPWPLLYNLFDTEIKDVVLPKFESLLTEEMLAKFGLKKKNLLMSSWSNILQTGENIMSHRHSTKENSFMTTNLFVGGPTHFGTNYRFYGNGKNVVGRLVLLDGHLHHSVDPMSNIDIPRVSMVFDFTNDVETVHPTHPSTVKDDHKWYEVT